MNRKQRRTVQAKDKHKVLIHLRGNSYTPEQAGTLAIHEQNLGNIQVALDIYDLILTKTPNYTEIYNNRGNALLLLKRYDEALTSYNKAIALKPDYIEAHYNRGVAFQEMKRYDEALAGYNKAIMLKPNFAEAYYNRGNTLQVMQQYDEALANYDEAIKLKPDFAEAHNNRGNNLNVLRRKEEALASYENALRLKPNFIEAYNNRGNILYEMRRYNDALASYNTALSLKPDYAEAYNNRGSVLHEIERYDEALIDCEKALMLKPEYAEAHNNRGNTLQEMKRYEEALASCEKAIVFNPNLAEAHNNKSVILHKMKLYDGAIASAKKASEIKPAYAEAYQNMGVSLVSKGDMKEAEKMFLKAIEIRPDFANPLFTLAGIRKYKREDLADIKNIQTVLSKSSVSQRDKEYLYFSLGKIYDDCELYDDAFECYQQANQIRNATVSYNPERTSRATNKMMEAFSKEFLAQIFASASDSKLPLFIVGMPRSGTTLMASILSNHQLIDSAGELTVIADFTVKLPKLTGTAIPYPEAVKHITAPVALNIINTYKKRLMRDAKADITHVIDKHPLNFRHLGLISMLFPKARIIHCKRHPLDIGLSNYFQRFSLDYDYSFDLRNIGHFYEEYCKLMEHWKHILPTPIIEVSYEDMILNTESMVRRVLGLLGLEWDERCLAPHTNPTPIETASNWQVRQPIYTQSVDRWKHYEKHLTPLKEILHIS